MFIKEFSMSNLMTTGVNVVIMWLIGIISLAILAVMVTTSMQAYENYTFMNNLDASPGRVHIVEAVGTYNCTLVETGGYLYVSDPNDATCMGAAHHVKDWRSMAIAVPEHGVIELFLMAVASILVILAAYPIVRIIPFLLAVLIAPLRYVYPLMLLVFMVPVIAYLSIAFGSAWFQEPNMWKLPESGVVTTYEAYITKDQIYRKPHTFFQWTDGAVDEPDQSHSFNIQ